MSYRTPNPAESVSIMLGRTANERTAEKTDPELWQAVVDAVKAGDAGGRSGQWSARKAQLAVRLYQEAGGGYLGPKTADNSLARWTAQRWRTGSGEPSLVTGERYLPKAALAALTDAEIAATDRAKRRGMREGQQYVAQPEKVAAKTARYRRK